MYKYTNFHVSGLTLGIIGTLAFSNLSRTGERGEEVDKHNLIFADQWRAEAAVYAGNTPVKSPNIDRLADGITSITEELIEVIGSESKDFAVKGGLAQPVKNSMLLSIFSIIWIAFTNIFVMADFGSLFRGKKNGFSSNGASAITGQGNLEEIIVPAIIIGIYLCGLNEKI